MKKILAFLKMVYRDLFNKSQAAIIRYVTPSILVVEKIKNILDSQTVQFVLDIIPGTIDNSTASKIKTALPRILSTLRLTNECAKLETNDQIIVCALEALKKTDPGAKSAFYLSIASMLAEALSDNKLTWGEAVILAQFTYTEKIKKA